MIARFILRILFLVGLGWIATRNKGYVLIEFFEWELGLSLTLFVAILLLFIAIVLWIFSLLGSLSRRRFRRRVLQSEQGLKLWLAGDYRKANQRFMRGRSYLLGGLLNSVGALVTSYDTGREKEQKKSIDDLTQHPSFSEFLLDLLMARLLLSRGAPEAALERLEAYRATRQWKKTGLQQTRFAALKALGHWAEIEKDLALFRKHDAITREEFPSIHYQAARAALIEAVDQGENALEKRFRSLSSSLRAHPELVTIYIRGLMEKGEMVSAERHLSRTLSSDWNPDLLTLYGEIRLLSYDRMFQRCEAWLKSRPEDPQLLFITGKLAYRCQLWGRAQDYLELSLKGFISLESYLLLGQLHEKLDDLERASDYYEKAARYLLCQNELSSISVKDVWGSLPLSESRSLPAPQ
jgi:HemY protein